MGVVYTIVGLDHRPNRVGLPSGIFLAGIEPYRARSGRLLGFDPCDWRAVVEPKTDISIFQAMLNPAQETVDVG